ncbi:uncharacterized protein LOC128548573 [Mercenaria mercenaria]|uniref:uncharacterized protein LOC128548573 n=1 Tax=Mercenaria mercenaria TaxID=6596 RepID=UPI00234E9D4E|nr:uncharacterized protein LOC128548573 [Mercenaria mercenaria]
MESIRGDISILLFMSAFLSLKTTSAQGTDSSFSPKSNLSDHFNMATHSLGTETPHEGSDTKPDYSIPAETATSNDINNSMSYNYSDYYDYGDEYIYPGYPFERPMYLYIWETLVILTFLVNIVVVSILLRKKMRSATNLILAAIAISDTLTGLITLPTYIMVYQNYDPLPDSHYMYNDYNSGNITTNDSTSLSMDRDTRDMLSNQDLGVSTSSAENQTMSFVSSNPLYDGTTEIPRYNLHPTHPPLDGYILTKDLCRGFMISKYFLSKMFHTVSIFLTLFLGIQRYVSVAFPFKSQSIFTVKKTIIFCVVISVISPVLHVYHLATDKAEDGLCQWTLGEEGCGGDCIYLWVLFFVRHLVPCVSLTTFTILFIKHLRLGTRNLRRIDSNASQVLKRKEENRRISIIVTAIVIVFLIPEIPYGIFLLYSAVQKTVIKEKYFHLETNRAIHMAYEILLVLTFNANFYIYTFLNKKFRKCLYRTYIKPMQRLVGDTRRLSISRTSTISKMATRKTDCSSSQGAIELKAMQTSSSDRSVTMETKLKQSVSPDTSKSCSNVDSNELSALNANV